ncbi:divergent PAP2 family protein [Candidatus Woesearchaeota archaeon]|nr:divergent PAP2 family protein [Candidatus Woesearchaeota archaeon]
MVNILIGLLQNRIFLICIFTWFISQLIKFFIYYVKHKKFHFRLFTDITSGGMPSSHAAIAAALATMVYREEGISTVFLITLAIIIFIIHNALLLRKHFGDQAKILNTVLQHARVKGFQKNQRKEYIGHEPLEVFTGLLLGLAMALLFY